MHIPVCLVLHARIWTEGCNKDLLAVSVQSVPSFKWWPSFHFCTALAALGWQVLSSPQGTAGVIPYHDILCYRGFTLTEIGRGAMARRPGWPFSYKREPIHWFLGYLCGALCCSGWGLYPLAVLSLVLLGYSPSYVLEIVVLCWIDQKQLRDRKVHKPAALEMFRCAT